MVGYKSGTSWKERQTRGNSDVNCKKELGPRKTEECRRSQHVDDKEHLDQTIPEVHSTSTVNPSMAPLYLADCWGWRKFRKPTNSVGRGMVSWWNRLLSGVASGLLCDIRLSVLGSLSPVSTTVKWDENFYLIRLFERWIRRHMWGDWWRI